MAKYIKPKVKLRKQGVFARSSRSVSKWTIVAPRIQLFARGQRLSDGSYLAQFRFKEMNGAIKDVFFDWSFTLAQRKRELKATLATAGYEWPRDGRLSESIWAALVDSRPKRKFSLVSAPGWYDDAFVLPDKFFRPNKSTPRVRIDPNSPEHVGSFTLGEGSLSDWQRDVGKPARKSSPLCVAISAALAAPLLRKFNMDSFAINWFGNTSEGKTLTLKVAASVAGLFGPGGGLPSWADSESGFEGQAMGHRDCVLPLDETADGEGKMTLPVRARTLAFGIGRNRPRTLSAAYERTQGFKHREYRIIVLSSSERALGDVAREAGTPRLGGEEVRLIDIPASVPGSLGIFDGTIADDGEDAPTEIARRLAERLGAGAQKYQGHLFQAFLGRLIKDEQWVANARDYKVDFEAKVNVSDLKAVLRIRSNFAVIWAAAALAIDYKLLPWKKSHAWTAIEKCLRRALSALHSPATTSHIESDANGPTALLQELRERLQNCELRNIAPRIKVSDDEATARQKADGFVIKGVTYLKRDQLELWFPKKVDRVALRGAGAFLTKRPDTATVDKKVNGISGKPRYYALNANALNESEA
jgi:putative DNA primase/helicase